MENLYVGIDVSKEKFSAQGIDERGKKRFYLEIPMDSHGFSELLRAIKLETKDLGNVTVAMESTACYHINLFSFLTSKGIKVFVVNPLVISNFVKLSLRKTKTDKKDALAIARFLILHKDSLEQLYVKKDISDLRDLTRQRETLVDQMTAIKMDTKRLLNVTFPELEKVVALFTKSILRLLMKYPSAHAVRKARSAAIGKQIIPGSYGKMTAETVSLIKEAAAGSVGTMSFTKEVVIRQKASMLLQLDEHLQEITSLLTEQCEAMMQQEMEILKSIKGIGNKGATNFLVEMGGEIKNYKSHRKLIAMAGIDPAVYQSGKYDGRGRISKRGNSHLRRVIWLMAEKVVQFNEYFRAYYLKRREDGLPYKKAVMATAHKLIRTIFAMLSNRTFFNAKVT